MRIRELGGYISRATEIQVFVLYEDSAGYWLTISKPSARLICEDAQKKGVEDIEVETIGTVVRIGAEHTMGDDEEANEVGPVCSGCGAEWSEAHECEP